MNKQSQSLVDLFQTMPLSSFLFNRGGLSSSESQNLYNIWLHNQKDVYGKYIVPEEITTFQVEALQSKGYIHKTSRQAQSFNKIQRTCEFTAKAKDLIKTLVLSKEKSALEKTASLVKTASKHNPMNNWLTRVM